MPNGRIFHTGSRTQVLWSCHGDNYTLCLHSTITVWGRENEVKAFKNMLTQVTMLSFIIFYNIMCLCSFQMEMWHVSVTVTISGEFCLYRNLDDCYIRIQFVGKHVKSCGEKNLRIL